MGSRGNREAAAAHQPLLSSLVVRLTDNERTADFEPGEVNRHSRSTRFYQDPPALPVARILGLGNGILVVLWVSGHDTGWVG
uniref:Uncharacterized protein n=1 Tax=Kalanchoe fedtschenkoi TaxID=63787 RepID=A0A7N0ZYQ2_KALFE